MCQPCEQQQQQQQEVRVTVSLVLDLSLLLGLQLRLITAAAAAAAAADAAGGRCPPFARQGLMHAAEELPVHAYVTLIIMIPMPPKHPCHHLRE
jgi:hypothetical protein